MTIVVTNPAANAVVAGTITVEATFTSNFSFDLATLTIDSITGREMKGGGGG